MLEHVLASTHGPFELGFFGGTFTGLDQIWQSRFLDCANTYRHAEQLAAIRISTRPDRVTPQSLTWLREQGVGMVELGVQSFTSSVLKKSGRGYSERGAIQACAAVQAAGVHLGIQLLPGLPGHTPAHWRDDVHHAIALAPKTVRIYPCVVLSETVLSQWHEQDRFSPWPLDQAVQECAWAVRKFWEHGIAVIRLGLPGEPGMLKRLVTGPWHPAFGNMVRSRVLRDILTEQLAPTDRVSHLFLPARLSGELWGHRGEHKKFLGHWGITPQTVSVTQTNTLTLDLENSHAQHTCY
ncbi:radical SAM protein [Desulfovibrionales bacterium]